MGYKHSYIIFLVLVLSAVLVVSADAAVNLYLYPPSQDYFSSLNIGNNFTVEIVASVDDPGVTLFAFTVAWTPEVSVEFVHPVSENSSELVMTGFFPPTDSNHLSETAPNWRSPAISGGSGATPEIVVFTAPAANYSGTDSLVRITFRKLSVSQPTFTLNVNATAAQRLGETESIWIPASPRTAYTKIDFGSAQMSGVMLPQATGAVVTVGGNDYPANVVGNKWALEIKTVLPGFVVQPVMVKFMQGDSLLTSVTTMEIIRSPGWFKSAENHGEPIGDSDGNGSKDLLDLVILAQSYRTSAGNIRYDFRCDYNADGVVNLADLLIFTYYGR